MKVRLENIEVEYRKLTMGTARVSTSSSITICLNNSLARIPLPPHSCDTNLRGILHHITIGNPGAVKHSLRSMMSHPIKFQVLGRCVPGHRDTRDHALVSLTIGSAVRREADTETGGSLRMPLDPDPKVGVLGVVGLPLCLILARSWLGIIETRHTERTRAGRRVEEFSEYFLLTMQSGSLCSMYHMNN